MHASQVAFMFLTRGVVYHEATWEVWFRSAAGLLPTAALHAADCADGAPPPPLPPPRLTRLPCLICLTDLTT